MDLKMILFKYKDITMKITNIALNPETMRSAKDTIQEKER